MPIFFKPSASDFSLSADSIGNRWLQEPVVRPNGFPLYHWIQTERGEGLLTLKGQELLLKPGDGVLIAPHVPHEYRENDGSGMWFTSFLTFDGKLSDDLYKICAVSPYLFVPASEGAWFQEWIDRIIDSHFLKNDIDDAALSVGCFEFLTRLSQLRTGLSRTEHPLYLQYVRPAMQEIESHLSDPLNVDDLAEQLHITPQYLTRLFQRFVGSSVRSNISDLRIRRAKELGLAAILRVFLLDSIALESLDKIPANLPDCLDLLPGAMPKILRRVCAKAKVPVLTGGLIADKEDVLAALEAGATAISTTNQAVWDM